MIALSSPEEAEEYPLGRRLFALEGVANVFIMPDFLTITKREGAAWNRLVPKVKQVLADHFEHGDG